MAIYHLSMKIISRGNGQNAVASAAYRSGEKLIDEQDGTTKFYERSVLPETHILAPDNVPKWVYDRQTLWNKVERCENRVNSQLSRELEIALPLELTNEEQTKLIKEFIQFNCVDKGMVADIAIHRDHPENPHAHVMLTMREINQQGFQEKNRDWNKVSYLEQTRKRWAEVCNKYLEKAHSLERIDHRSYKEQELDLIPTEHVGVKGKMAERLGIELDNKVIQRNKIAEAYNQKVISLQEKRDELLNAGLTEKTKNPDTLVVTYRLYMENQRTLRIAYNKQNFYENKLKKKGTLSLFEREQLKKAKTDVKTFSELKWDYLANVEHFLNEDQSVFVSYANAYGNAQAEKIKARLLSSGKPIPPYMEKYIARTGNRLSEEMKVRFSDAIKQLGTSDSKTVVSYVEKQLHTNTARKLVKGWVNHESVTLKLRELQKQLTDYQTSKVQTIDKKAVKLLRDIASLEHVKQFYEAQALSTLYQKGFGELAEKYNTEKAQAAVVAMYDELVKNPKIKTANELETVTFNNFKLRRVQAIVRGELSGTNIQKRLDSLEQWKTIQERNIAKLSKEPQTPELLEQLETKKQGLLETKQSIQLIHEGVNILDARSRRYLATNPEISKELAAMELSPKVPFSQRMSMSFKQEANYHLFLESTPTYNQKELVTKMYDNILDYKEYTIEKASKNVLYRHEYSSYKAILGNLNEYTRQKEELGKGLSEAQNRVENQPKLVEQLEQKWAEKEAIETKKFMLGKSEKLATLQTWFSDNQITASTKSGALNQLNYQYNQASYQVTKYKELDELKIPALKNLQFITENKAVRTIEKDFGLQAGFNYHVRLSEAEKEVFVSYAELKKQLGTDHLDTQKMERKIQTFTEQFKEADTALKSTQTLLKEKEERLSFFEKSTAGRLESFRESLAATPEAMNQTKENIEKLKEFRTNEMKKMKQEIQTLRTQETVQKQAAQTKGQLIGLAKNFTRSLSSYKNQVSEAEMKLTRKQRMKALEKDNGLELEL